MKIGIGITGASGSIYAQLLLRELSKANPHIEEVGFVMSGNAPTVWKEELQNEDYNNFQIKKWAIHDYYAPFASGSAGYDAFVIIPCSMGTLGRIAHGISDNLITRAADVMLKERKKLICVARETPLNMIHIENMQKVAAAGGIICPATPSFYSRPQTIEDLAYTVVHRVINLLGLPHSGFVWGK